VRNVQVRTPRGDADPLADLVGHVNLVLIDAPCTGTGTWRRNPDAKWRIRPGAVDQRKKIQAELLDRAAALVERGGRIAYITCSVLAEENGEQIQAFLQRRKDFTTVAVEEMANALGDHAAAFLPAALVMAEGLLMTPRRTQTDGFFVSALARG
jgi:16S rRNA (cytosine967-C5)-methyltransferase